MEAENEVFELCKQVYEVTRWDSNELQHELKRSLPDELVVDYPLYTSDYLLEKLPESILLDKQYKRWLSMDNLGSDGWQFSYRAERTAPLYASVSETPLKALLKLTLALNKAGVEL